MSFGLYLIYTDGTIVEYEFKKNTSLKKIHEDKVAYDPCGYATLVDDFGGLQIVGGSGKMMMNIHPLTKERTQMNSKVPLRSFDYSALRILVGPFLWILGGGIRGCGNLFLIQNYTCPSFKFSKIQMMLLKIFTTSLMQIIPNCLNMSIKRDGYQDPLFQKMWLLRIPQL